MSNDIMSDTFPDYKLVNLDSLIPYAMNSRTHSDAQVDKIAASIKEFGFLNPVIADGDNGIIAGHGRVMAAKKVGLDVVPVIEAKHLTDAQRRAYVIADNRLALDAGWDYELLKVELENLQDANFDLELTGFDVGELDKLFEVENENQYTQKVDSPIYEPIGEKPSVDDLYDSSKTKELIEQIETSNLEAEEKAFLMAAAYRHTVIDFEKVANFYAHSSEECQRLMENSALVIIDFDKAISEGYVRLNEQLSQVFDSEYGSDNDD